jgi:hypothetical protein
MNLKHVLAYLWKLPLGALAFFVGITLGGMAAMLLGLPNPGLPEGADQATLSLCFLLASLTLALALAFVARGLAGGFFTRRLILAFLIKATAAPPRFGRRWRVPVPWYAFIWPLTQRQGERAYAQNPERKARAVAMGRAALTPTS